MTQNCGSCCDWQRVIGHYLGECAKTGGPFRTEDGVIVRENHTRGAEQHACHQEAPWRRRSDGVWPYLE